MSRRALGSPHADLPPPLSLTSRFVAVFLSPARGFRAIAREPDFLAPLIAVVIASVAVAETILAKIGMERIIRNALEQSGRASSLSGEQLDQAVAQGARIGAIFAHLGGLVGPPILLLILAALGLAILNGIFGKSVDFKTAFAIACYANLPKILEALMALAMIFFGDPEHFSPQTPVPSNLGFFLNPVETSKPLYSLASSVDIFTLWILVLLGIGYSEATGRTVKALSIFLTYVGLWMIWVLGKVGLAMLT